MNKYISAISRSNTIGVRHNELEALVKNLYTHRAQLEALRQQVEALQEGFSGNVRGGPNILFTDFTDRLKRHIDFIEQIVAAETMVIAQFAAYMRGETDLGVHHAGFDLGAYFSDVTSRLRMTFNALATQFNGFADGIIRGIIPKVSAAELPVSYAYDEEFARLIEGIDPSKYSYSYHQRIAQEILDRANRIHDSRFALDGLNQALNGEYDLKREIEFHTNGNIFTQIIDRFAGVDDDYRDMLDQTNARIERYPALLEQLNGNIQLYQGEIEERRINLYLPGNPDVWQQYLNGAGAGNRQSLYAGCTAYVASQMHLPEWTTLSGAAGNANQWPDNARRYSASHPELGITVDSTPRVGSVAAWSWNHVAVVREIDPNNPNRLLISQANTSRDATGNYNQAWGTWTGQNDDWIDISSRTYRNADFIHLPWSETGK